MFIRIEGGAVRASAVEEVFIERPKEEEVPYAVMLRLSSGPSIIADIVKTEKEAEETVDKIVKELNDLERGG